MQIIKLRKRINNLLARRPHRSFRRSRRRDYIRGLKLPGYWSFTAKVHKLLWKNKRLFLSMALFYSVLSAILVGLASQDTYIELADMLQETGSEIFTGNWGEIGKASLLLGTSVLGGINQTPSEAQRIFAPLIFLLVWLSTIWLLRSVMAGQKPRLRDALYNSGSPIVSTLLVSLVFLIQLLPAAFAALGFWAATQTGFIWDGLESMLFWVLIILLLVLSLYWGVSTFIAMIIITLPGMYPMRAIQTAGDMIVGRRLKILLRLLWMASYVVVTWFFIVVPIIIIDAWLKDIWPNTEWLPVVPVTILLLSSLTVVWSTAYIYILYRKIVDDDTKTT